MKSQATLPSMRVFTLVWFGQLISLLGSSLTSFGLGVWVYRQSDSVTQFALISLCATLPKLVVLPLAGTLVDRWNRRWVMIGSDTGSALSTLAIALLFISGSLQVWHIYIATAVSAVCAAFQTPAYAAAMTQLVPKEQLGRSNGMVQLGEALAELGAPIIAGVLIGLIGLGGIILLDFGSFLFAVTIMLLVRFPRYSAETEAKEAEQPLLQAVTYGWRYLSARAGLLALIVFFTVGSFLVGLLSVLLTPLILSFSSEAALGATLSIAGLGMLGGAIAMSAWGGPKRRIYGVLGFFGLCGLSLIGIGLQASTVWITAAAFCLFFTLPFINASASAIMQSKVEPAVQGRVFSVRQMLTQGATPLAYLIAGPLADRVFEPLLAAQGPLAGSVGRVIGTGVGRGIGLMFITVGLLVIALAAVGFLYPRLRHLEDELPDVALPAAETDEPAEGGAPPEHPELAREGTAGTYSVSQ